MKEIEEENVDGGYEDILADYDKILDDGYNGLIEACKNNVITEPTLRFQSFQEILIGACGGKFFMPNPGFVTISHQPNGTPCVDTLPFKAGKAHVLPTTAAAGPSTEHDECKRGGLAEHEKSEKGGQGSEEECDEIDSGEEGDEKSQQEESYEELSEEEESDQG